MTATRSYGAVPAQDNLDARDSLFVNEAREPVERKSWSGRVFNYFWNWPTATKVATCALAAGVLVTGITSFSLMASYQVSPPLPTNITQICNLLPTVGQAYLNCTNIPLIQNLAANISNISVEFCSGTVITNPQVINASQIAQKAFQNQLCNQTAYAVTGSYPNWNSLTISDDFYEFIYYVVTRDSDYAGSAINWYQEYTFSWFSLDMFRKSCFTVLQNLCSRVNSFAPVFTSNSTYSCMSERGFASGLIEEIVKWQDAWPRS